MFIRGRGRGGAGTEGCTPALWISQIKGSSECPRCLNEGYIFVPRYEVWGENTPNIHKISKEIWASDTIENKQTSAN